VVEPAGKNPDLVFPHLISTPVIDFEDEEKKLHITDPFFAFYLRWGELLSR